MVMTRAACASSAWALRTASSARLRSVMSLLVSSVASPVAVSVLLHGPPARNGDPRAISPGVHELPFPPPDAEHDPLDLVERAREDRLQQLVRDFAERLVALPSVQLLGAAIPVGDRVVLATNEKRVVGEVEKAGLLPQYFLCALRSSTSAWISSSEARIVVIRRVTTSPVVEKTISATTSSVSLIRTRKSGGVKKKSRAEMATTDTISAGTSLADSERITMTNRNSSAAVALSA